MAGQRQTPPTTPQARLGIGDAVRPRRLRTIRGEPVEVPAADALTHLSFRRFASCPICNVHLRTVVRRHTDIVEAGVRPVVVFHSPVDAMLPHQGDLPFATIADPDYALYREFGVEFSLRAVLDPRAWTAPLKASAWSTALRELHDPGGKPFSIRGASMLGLPAEFLIEPDGQVVAVKYGRHAADQWSVDDVLEIAAATPRPGTN
ncbi:MAG: peroxiredoxin-like family protein [Propionibacteriaceae bacterium]